MQITLTHFWDVSPAQAVDLQKQLASRVKTTALVLACNSGFRLPEPTRRADRLVALKQETC
jgi:hypothetical protein